MSQLSALMAVAVVLSPGVLLAQLTVVSTVPARNATAAPGTSISIQFDQPLDTATVNAASFRAYGQWSGSAGGTYSFSNANQTVTLTPSNPFSAGEFVFVNLSHDIKSATAVPLRTAGYAFQFITAVVSSSATFAQIDRFDNKTGSQTRIYGASAADLNNDEYLDLATINEVSGDVRVFLNLADGTGLFGPMESPQGIGFEASPNAPADFNNDGNMDLCVAAASTHNVWVLLGAGDGSFSSITGIPIGAGSEPHGIVPIDVDGDGDLDIVNANLGFNNLSLLLNNGAGSFGAPSFFEGGVLGEYGLAVAEMNGDGISDLVVAGRNGSQIITQLGNGDGTFTAAGPNQFSGGTTWVVVLGDMNGDGELDAACANDGDGNVGILLGQGDGTFGAVATIGIGSHVPSVDLGDLDGDGDPDLVVSSFGGGFWSWYRNGGNADFTQIDAFPAPANPSCAVLFDSDNDGDLDMALTDEIDDTVTLMENGGMSACSPAPRNCRFPILAEKAKLVLKDNALNDARDSITFTWRKGEATSKAQFGDPTIADSYVLCLYEDDALVEGFEIPAGQTCNGRPCWKNVKPGYTYRDRELTPDGIVSSTLVQGIVDGKARVKVRGKGPRLGLPDLTQLNGVLDVQLQRVGNPLCWGATYTPPFRKQQATILNALSDPPPLTTLPLAIWSDIHSHVVAPVCSSCHGGSGGLSGLGDCNTGYASLVGAASTEMPAMDRVEPGDPSLSWIMHKLDGTQGMFTPMCSGMFCGSQMPLGGPYLSAELRDIIRAWIMDGALNDCP